jgi:amino acid transporter
MGAHKYQVNRYQILSLALCSVLSNSICKFGNGLQAGLGYQIIFNVIAVLACGVYYCCVSELTSTFPFPGGSFGFARCTVGFYPGFLVGCLEFFYYATSVGVTASAIALALVDSHPEWELRPVVVVLVVILIQFFLCMSKKVVFNLVAILALYGILVNLVFILGSWTYVDFNSWAFGVPATDRPWNDDQAIGGNAIDDDTFYRNYHINTTLSSSERLDVAFNDDPIRIVQIICDCLAIYMQIEFANLSVEDAKEPRTDIPFAMLATLGIQIIFGTIHPILASGMSPGIQAVSALQFPLVPGKP